ncbi:MAG TPA: hypothetical protein VF628_07625 [Allosphingosinicella sp.]|jgi:hypothetical protein
MASIAEQEAAARRARGEPPRPGDIPPEILEYQSIDLGPNSEAVAWLDVRSDMEELSEHGVVRLTDDLDQAPAGLTPNMSSWYSRFIASRRHAAIAAARSRFEADSVRNVPSVLLECEVDQVRHKAARDKHRRLNEFYVNHAPLKAEAEQLTQDYELMRAEQGGRKPRMVSPLLYGAGLTVVVLLELFVNFESFMSVPYISSPFLATGITGLVALAIGWAAHLHGTLLRQWDYFFGPHDRVLRLQGWRMLGIGTVLLLIALGAVLGARYFYILPRINNAILLGSEPPSLLGSLSFMIAGNVIVYLVGAAWAYVTHDEIPDYPSVKRRSDAKRAEYDRAFRRDVADEINRLDQKAAADVERLGKRAIAQEVSPNHVANRRLFQLVRNKDEEVAAILKDYRARLSRNHPKVKYLYPDREVSTEQRFVEISAGEWAAKDLPLKYHLA